MCLSWLASLGHYRPCSLVVNNYTDHENNNETDDAKEDLLFFHEIIILSLNNEQSLTACFLCVKLFLAIVVAHL